MTNEQKITLYRFANMRSNLDKFEDKALLSMLKTYNKAKKELLTDIDRLLLTLPENSFSVRRARVLLDEVLLTSKVIQQLLINDIEAITTEAGKYSYNEINKIVSWDDKVLGFDAVSLSATQLSNAILSTPLGGRTLDEWVEKTFTGMIDEIKDELNVGYAKGEGYRKLANRLSSGFDVKKRDAVTLARTYVQAVNVDAATDIYNANTDVVQKLEWSAIMENGDVATGRGTCPRCQALDGLQWEVEDKSRPNCPLHQRCRCMLVAVTKTWRELGFDIDEMEKEYKPWTERANRATGTGGVPILDYGFTDKNYAGWWATRSKTFQNNAIGPRRADLVRSGDIDFIDIVNRKTGDLYTLKELASIHSL